MPESELQQADQRKASRTNPMTGHGQRAGLVEQTLVVAREALRRASAWSYRPGQPSASEPAAWTACALALSGQLEAARPSALWLAERQQGDGSVGVSAADEEPRWCTPLAILAWKACDQLDGDVPFAAAVDKAVAWSLSDRGKTAPRDPAVGHDTTLVGWSWAANTHSWLEPTCFFTLALRACGQGDHPRVREGVRLIADRLLDRGGANYGNTYVLGQELVPHVEPSGLAMLALAGETTGDSRVAKTLDYLSDESARPNLGVVSLAYALMGLTAWDRRPEEADALLDDALTRQARSPAGGPSLYAQSLALVASDAVCGSFVNLCCAGLKAQPSPPSQSSPQ